MSNNNKVYFKYLKRFHVSHYFPQLVKKGITLEIVIKTPKDKLINVIHLSSIKDKQKLGNCFLSICNDSNKGGFKQVNSQPKMAVNYGQNAFQPQIQENQFPVHRPSPNPIEEDLDVNMDGEEDVQMIDNVKNVNPPNFQERNSYQPKKKAEKTIIRKKSKRKMVVSKNNNRGLKFSKTKICVAVRKRPMNKKERGNNEIDICELVDSKTIQIHEPKIKVDLTRYVQSSDYFFDVALDEFQTNQDVYYKTTKSLVDHVFNNGKATCFAYGQTGSGKTYTMMGNGTEVPGIYLLASLDIFKKLNPSKQQLYISFFEIYGGKLYDLLNNKKRLVTREDGNNKVNIVGLQEHHVGSVKELLQIIEYGHSVRQTGCTGANDESSRSHAVLDIKLKKLSNGKEIGKFSFIDLAGSERGADTYFNDKQTRLEGAEINKSLLALKECIRGLDQQNSHIPFRGSKLTEVLKDSFVGNSKTVMIANISPNSGSCEHTLNTIRYADRVKEIRSDKKGGKQKRLKIYCPQVQSHHVVKISKKKKKPKPKKKPKKIAKIPNIHFNFDQEGLDSLIEANNKMDIDSDVNYMQQPQQKPRRKEFGTTELERAHEELINKILEEEEEVIASHRKHIDEIMEYVKQEMNLLHQVEQPGSAIDEYVTNLDLILVRKIQNITALRNMLAKFQSHLKEEEILSKSFQGK